MTAVAHFYCRPNSHPFQERHVALNEPTKIGRSVARCRPAPNNAVFDCKVLSRNHALLWFENGKFYLQDTKSSNGTFVNNQRLSKASEESSAVEVNSCDVVQFGVDVVDSMRKVTHGCIVSQLRLYLPNGEESKQSSCTWNNQLMEKVPYNGIYPVVQAQDLYQLHRYLQEALHREQMLEQKLALLQRLVVSSQDASEKGWQALIDEDRLLSRLEFLENQLQAYSKTQNEDTLQTQLQQVQEEKYNYENTSKETLRQVVQEKLEAVRKLSNLEHSLGTSEDECAHLRHVHEEVQSELTSLAASNQDKMKEIQEVTEKLQDVEKKHTEAKKEFEKEKIEMERKFEELQEEEKTLRENMSLLEEDNGKLKDLCAQLESKNDDISTKATEMPSDRSCSEKRNPSNSEESSHHVTAVDKAEQDGEKEIENDISAHKDSDGSSNETSENNTQNNEEAFFNDATERLQQQLHEATEELATRTQAMTDVKDQLKAMQDQLSRVQEEKTMEEEERKRMEQDLVRLQEERDHQAASLNETNKELQAALNDRESLIDQEDKIRSTLEDSESIMKLFQSTDNLSDEEEIEEDLQEPFADDQIVAPGSFLLFKAKLKKVLKKLKNTTKSLEQSEQANAQLKDQLASLPMVMEGREAEQKLVCNQLVGNEDESTMVDGQMSSHGDPGSMEKLKDVKKQLKRQEEEIRRLKEDLSSTQETARLLPDVQTELASTQTVAHEREVQCATLQEQLHKAGTETGVVKNEVLSLQSKLFEEQDISAKHSIAVEELSESCSKQVAMIEVLQNREQEALDKLGAVLEELRQKENKIGDLEKNLKESLFDKENFQTKIDELNTCLTEMATIPDRIRKGSLIPGAPGKSPRLSPKSVQSGKSESRIAPPSSTRLPKPSPRPFIPHVRKPLRQSPKPTNNNLEEEHDKPGEDRNILNLRRRRDLVSDVMFDNAISKSSIRSFQDEFDMTSIESLTPPAQAEKGVYYINSSNHNQVFIPKLIGVGDEEADEENVLVTVRRASLLNIKTWAEKEKTAIREELQRLEETRQQQEQLLKEQIETNISIRKSVDEDNEKWESRLVAKDNELAEVTSRSLQLIKERDAVNHHRSSPMKRLFLVAIIVALLSFFYVFLYADPIPEHPM